jgi:hypothetical protein
MIPVPSVLVPIQNVRCMCEKCAKNVRPVCDALLLPDLLNRPVTACLRKLESGKRLEIDHAELMHFPVATTPSAGWFTDGMQPELPKQTSFFSGKLATFAGRVFLDIHIEKSGGNLTGFDMNKVESSPPTSGCAMSDKAEYARQGA